MPRKDRIHDAIKSALVKDGWTITDGDGDHASSPVQVTVIGNETTFVAFDDDGPTVTRTGEPEVTSLETLNLDETIGPANSPTYDRYAGAEPHDNNGGADDVPGVTTVTVSTAPSQGEATAFERRRQPEGEGHHLRSQVQYHVELG